MIGKLNINNSGGGTYEITFNVVPPTAIVVVRDDKNSIVEPIEDKKYKLKMGIYTYEVSYEGYKTVQGEIGVLKDTTIIVELEEVLKTVTWADGTDEEIAKMLEAHYAGKIDISDYWAVGDTRLVHLNAIGLKSYTTQAHVAQDIMMVIIGIEHDDLQTKIGNKTKAAITVQCRELLGNNGNYEVEYYWGERHSAVQTENWTGNPMRTWYNTDFINAMPSTFKSLVKDVQKKNITEHTSKTETITTVEKTFLLSYSEVFGGATSNQYMYGNNPGNYEGTQYQYYQTSSNRIKYINNNGSKGDIKHAWWLRSPASDANISSRYGCSWCAVNDTGASDSWIGDVRLSLSPAFCL